MIAGSPAGLHVDRVSICDRWRTMLVQPLGPGGCLEQLRRLQSGPFQEDAAIALDRLQEQPELVTEHLLGLAQLLPELSAVVVTERGQHLAAHGNTLGSGDIEDRMMADVSRAEGQNSSIKVFSRAGELLAIAEETMPGTLRPRIVLV